MLLHQLEFVVSVTCCGRCMFPNSFAAHRHNTVTSYHAPELPCHHWSMKWCHSYEYSYQKCQEAQGLWGKGDQCEMGRRGFVSLSSGPSSILFGGMIASFSFAEDILRNQAASLSKSYSQLYFLRFVLLSRPRLFFFFNLTSTSLGFHFHKLLALSFHFRFCLLENPSKRESHL